MLFLKYCIVILGLTCPGYVLARSIRLKHALAAAFPLSALLMTETVILFSLLDIPIRFASVSVVLLICVVAGSAVQVFRRPAPVEPVIQKTVSTLPRYLILGISLVAAAIVVAIAVRTTLYPLLGLDTIFRWEGLARAMLTQQSLHFYPPVTADNYNHYLFPDGIPPLVATIYWWIYATLGTPMQQATSISVTLQLIATMAMVFFGTSHAFGTRAAWFALLALSATPLLLIGFANGQESGFLALSVAGQLCFAWAAVRNPQRRLVVAAALFATLGALTRDYGPALALAGFAVLAWNRPTRRHLWLYLLTITFLATPWYLRNWVITGNPFFSHQLTDNFAVNPVHVAIIAFYKDVYAFRHLSLAKWQGLAEHLCTGAFLVIIAGGASIIRRREAVPLLITSLLATFLWAISVPQTAGGLLYSTRVLVPGLIALVMATGLSAQSIYETFMARKLWIRFFVVTVTVVLTGASFACVARYPFSPRFTFKSATGSPHASIQQVMLDRLETSGFPNTGVLTDQPFFAALMLEQSRFRPVVIWSPEVDFIFDPELTPEQIQKKLRERNIQLIFVDDQSTTNRFLIQHRFFYDSDSWKLLYELPREGAFYYFNPS